MLFPCCYHAISLLLVYRVKFRSEPKCTLRQKFYFQKTVRTHTLVTLMTPLKFKVILTSSLNAQFINVTLVTRKMGINCL